MSCKTINIDLTNVPPVPIQIGVAGENSFRTITFDASKWGADYPDATYTVVYRRSDGYLYPVLVNASADAIVWNPTGTDTAVSGNGQLEVRLLDGETIGKTIITQTYVAPSLSGDESEPSTPAPDWVNDVADDADRAEEAASHYPKIVNDYWWVWDVESGEYVSTGISAQGEDGVSPTVTVTAIEGGHRVTITDADGAHTFDVMDGEGGSGGGADVFIAVRGTTTEAEIREAHGAGKVVICVYQNRVYYLSDDGTVTLRTNPNEQGMVYELVVVGSRWTGINYNLALKSDIPNLSAYRTASAQDAIDAAQNTAIAAKYTKPSGGIPASDLAYGVIPAVPSASAAAPLMDGTAAAGSSAAYARGDHVHPSDTTKLDTTGNAYRSASIPMGHLDAASTATVMTATVDGITELRDGVCMWLRNGVITSESGFTINVNGLGAKPCYSSLAAASRSTTIFNANYTMLLIYNSTRVDGGCWDIVYGVDTNTTYTTPKLGFGYGTCTTAAATAAKTASISSYALTAGGIVSIKFDNDVPANATLNISSKGAKAMYYRGAAITAGVIKAGDTATFVYSTYYHLISIDRNDTGGTSEAPIQTVKVNGTALVPDANKSVDIPVPTVADVIEETVMVVQLTPTSTDLSGTMNRTGFEILAAHSAGKRIVAEIAGLNGSFEWNQAINGTMVTQFLYRSGGGRELIQVVAESGSSTVYHAYHIAQLPAVTASDNGKFLRVVNGAWAAATVPSAESSSFGGGS